MSITVGDIVVFRHYSSNNLYKTIINEVNGDNISIKLTKEVVTLNFSEGDPIVLLYETESKIYTVCCCISDIKLKQSIMTFKIYNTELLVDNKTVDRFAVSLYSDIRIKGSQRKDIATVRNVGAEGIIICSKVDYELEQELEIDLYIDKTLFFLQAEVIWKLNNPNNFEYGLSIYYQSLQIRNLARRHLQNLKEEQEMFIREMKEDTNRHQRVHSSPIQTFPFK